MAKTTPSASSNKNILQMVIAVLLVLSLAANGFLLWQYTEQRDELAEAEQTIDLFRSDPESAQQANIEQYIEQVGQVYDLPEDETPSLATVSDKEALDDQPFFERAENGDVVLIYPESQLAILFRPATGQLINMSSLEIDDSDALDVQSGQTDSSGLTTEED